MESRQGSWHDQIVIVLETWPRQTGEAGAITATGREKRKGSKAAQN
jgi:hypothetical protein